MSELTFAEFRAANLSRVNRWHPGFPGGSWMGADWSNAMCGEAGEAANVVKKLRRAELDVKGTLDPEAPVLVGMLADEIADTFTYLDLLAAYYGIDLAAAAVAKFDRVSVREGFPERLGMQGIVPTRAGREGDSQPMPTLNDSPAIHDLVADDLGKRKALGTERYGTPLQANNGRNALLDAYEEVLDTAVYLKQRLVEEGVG